MYVKVYLKKYKKYNSIIKYFLFTLKQTNIKIFFVVLYESV